ncbi:hypothetical protein ACHAWC_010888 [Mediolabrus comicus]
MAYLFYKQYSRRSLPKGKVHTGKTKPKITQQWSLCHELFFTHLHMMVSPYADQANSMNAEMVNLQSDKELDSFTKKVASGKTPRNKNRKKANSKSGGGGGGTMEVRSRRIRTGELVYNPYFIGFETTFNLTLAFMIGLASRWLFGLIRSLRLSSPIDGYCCSPYRGGDDDQPGAFEKFLACVLIKGNGDDALKGLIFSGLLFMMLTGIIRLASKVSAPHKSDDGENVEETQEGVIKRINPTSAKRFITFCLITLSSLWVFNTPSLLRLFGLDGLTAAIEECGARILLFCNLIGLVDLSSIIAPNSPDEPPAVLQSIMSALLILLALMYGYVASSMMTPINETARNAAHVLSPSPTKKQHDPSEMFQLMNTRIMLFIQGLAPFIIMITYIFHTKFAEAEKHKVRKSTFSANYLQNSGLFLRVALSWCFVGASIYTFRSLIQSYMDQAATVASAMAALGEGSDAKTGSKQPVDPFNERYSKVVYTASRVAVFPTFIFTLLVISHLYGGNGEVHPGIPSTQPNNGLLLPYSSDHMSWVESKNSPDNSAEAGGGILKAAIMSESSWYPTPFRDAAHNKLADILGRKNFCRAPELRSINALNRHVTYLLETDNDGNSIDTVLTTNVMTGRELLSFASKLDKKTTASCDESVEIGEEKECKLPHDEATSPPLRLLISSLLSHNILTPTVIFPIIDALSFLTSVWWTYWFSFKTVLYFIKLKGAAGALQIT